VLGAGLSREPSDAFPPSTTYACGRTRKCRGRFRGNCCGVSTAEKIGNPRCAADTFHQAPLITVCRRTNSMAVDAAVDHPGAAGETIVGVAPGFFCEKFCAMAAGSLERVPAPSNKIDMAAAQWPRARSSGQRNAIRAIPRPHLRDARTTAQNEDAFAAWANRLCWRGWRGELLERVLLPGSLQHLIHGFSLFQGTRNQGHTDRRARANVRLVATRSLSFRNFNRRASESHRILLTLPRNRRRRLAGLGLRHP